MKTRTSIKNLSGNGTGRGEAVDLPITGPEPHKPKFLSPNAWFAKQFPKIHAQYGNPIALKQNRDGDFAVDDISEDFFAAALGEHGCPRALVVAERA
ncbi:MAG: hypothetical protein FJY98_04260 [Candidatus Liptonbacteria bacterium]|nr:hypothetical protein [Candidatus Liptonbacteria bacterium]